METNPHMDTLPGERRLLPSLCWSAILGGTVAAIGIHILLTTLGIAAGLGTFTPMTDAHPATHLGIGAALAWSVCALIALWFGGVVAGRFSHSLHSGFVHGILVWSLTLIITVLLLSAGTGMVLGGALKALGGGLSLGTKTMASAAEGPAKESLKRSGDQLASFIDEAAQSLPPNSTPGATTRARREIGFALTRLFAPTNDIASPDNRAAAIKALVDNAQMSEADATKTVDAWIASYKDLRAELDKVKAAAEEKARAVADEAARALSHAAIWSFFALLIGLLVTALGGSYGARRALLHRSQGGPIM